MKSVAIQVPQREDRNQLLYWVKLVLEVRVNVELERHARLIVYKDDQPIKIINAFRSGMIETHFTTVLSTRERASGIINIRIEAAYITPLPPASIEVDISKAELGEQDITHTLKYDLASNAKHTLDRLLGEKSSYKTLQPLAQDLEAELAAAIAKQEPYSLIRLGDGEGRLLGYPEVFNVFEIIHECLGYQFGPRVFSALQRVFGKNSVDAGILHLRAMLIDAIGSADLVCVPTQCNFRNEITVQNLNAQSAQAVSLRMVVTYRPDLLSKLNETFIFRGMHRDGKLAGLLTGLPFLGLVSHSDATAALKEAFGVGETQFIQVPGHQTFMQSEAVHYPDQYRNIINQINVAHRGDVYLVAAGYLGKVYCHIIKSLGGIAIDIGSVFDGWVGAGRTEVANDERLRLKTGD